MVSPVVDLTEPAIESEVFLIPSDTDFRKSPIGSSGSDQDDQGAVTIVFCGEPCTVALT